VYVGETPRVDRTQLEAYDRATCYSGNSERTSRVTETMAAVNPDALANAGLPSVQRPRCTAQSLWGLARNISSVQTGSKPRRTTSSAKAQENIMVQVQRQLLSQSSGQEETQWRKARGAACRADVTTDLLDGQERE
jgi:hypothetical protein